MTLKTKITFKEYCKLLFGLTYKKPIMKVLIGVGVAMFIWILDYYLHLIPVPKPEIYQYITLSLISVVQPLVIFWTIKRNYNSSNHLGEPLEINVTEKEINVRGESFYLEIAWNKIFKIEEVNRWFLIYQNNLSAILVSKKDITTEDMEKFKTILKAIPNVPVHLKENN
jgi:YcxB-like protein